jgi:hypothetical protein
VLCWRGDRGRIRGIPSTDPADVAWYLQFRTIIQPFVHPLATARCFLRSPDRTIAWASSAARR